MLITSIIFSLLLIAAPLATFAYGQQPSQMSSNSSNVDNNINTNTNTLNIQDIPAKKVRVGDIDIAYKTFGKGDPVLLINGYSFAMDSWDPTVLLDTLSSNHTVIVFNNRGIGNTTPGDEQKFSISLFANDTAGLLEALNITKADVLAWSMGGRIAQELTLSIP